MVLCACACRSAFRTMSPEDRKAIPTDSNDNMVAALRAWDLKYVCWASHILHTRLPVQCALVCAGCCLRKDKCMHAQQVLGTDVAPTARLYLLVRAVRLFHDETHGECSQVALQGRRPPARHRGRSKAAALLLRPAPTHHGGEAHVEGERDMMARVHDSDGPSARELDRKGAHGGLTLPQGVTLPPMAGIAGLSHFSHWTSDVGTRGPPKFWRPSEAGGSFVRGTAASNRGQQRVKIWPKTQRIDVLL